MGKFVPLLIEVDCDYYFPDMKIRGAVPEYCKYGVENPGYHCLDNHCPYVRFIHASYELAYAGEYGEVPSGEYTWIGFGDEMEPQNYNKQERAILISLWQSICESKIKEAYEEYIITRPDRKK